MFLKLCVTRNVFTGYVTYPTNVLVSLVSGEKLAKVVSFKKILKLCEVLFPFIKANCLNKS